MLLLEELLMGLDEGLLGIDKASGLYADMQSDVQHCDTLTPLKKEEYDDIVNLAVLLKQKVTRYIQDIAEEPTPPDTLIEDIESFLRQGKRSV